MLFGRTKIYIAFSHIAVPYNGWNHSVKLILTGALFLVEGLFCEYDIVKSVYPC